MKPVVKVAVYAASAVALFAGVRMLVVTPESKPAHDPDALPAESRTTVLSGPESDGDFVISQTGSTRSDSEAEADRRTSGLTEVLANVEGPVYVEKVDGASRKGPAPKRLDLTPPKR